NVIETFGFPSGKTGIPPACGNLAASRPYRVLFFVIDDYRILALVFPIHLRHGPSAVQKVQRFLARAPKVHYDKPTAGSSAQYRTLVFGGDQREFPEGNHGGSEWPAVSRFFV